MKFNKELNELATAIKSSFQAGEKAEKASVTLAKEILLAIKHDADKKIVDQLDIDQAFNSGVYAMLGVEYTDQPLADLESGSTISNREHTRLRKCKSAAVAIMVAEYTPEEKRTKDTKEGFGYTITKDKRTPEAVRKSTARKNADIKAAEYVNQVKAHATANSIKIEEAAKELAGKRTDKKVAALIRRVPAIVKRDDAVIVAECKDAFKSWVANASLQDISKLTKQLSK